MSNILQLTDALLLLQPEGELWRFSVSGATTDQTSFTKNVIWEDGTAQCTWDEVQPKMASALTSIIAIGIDHKRKEAYERETDSLFFKEQRSEIEAGSWVAKVAEIKLRFPKS